MILEIPIFMWVTKCAFDTFTRSFTEGTEITASFIMAAFAAILLKTVREKQKQEI